MLQGKALVLAVMMLTAAPVVVTNDEVENYTVDMREGIADRLSRDSVDERSSDAFRPSDTLSDDLESERNALSDRLTALDESKDIDCLTLEQWKERFFPDDKVDDERKEAEENDRARGSDNSKEDEKSDDKKEDYSDKKDWGDKETIVKADDCLTAEEWELKFKSDEKEPCFTLEDIEKKMKDDRKHWHGDWDKEWERDWDEDWAEELELLSESCEGGDEEACEKLAAVREELAKDEEEEREEQEGSRSSDDDSEQDAESDEEWEEIRAVMEELALACEEGNEEACVELREMITEMTDDREEKNWDEDWDREERDWDEAACLTMEEWKEVFSRDWQKDWNHDRDRESKSDRDKRIVVSQEEWTAISIKVQQSDLTDEERSMIQEGLGMNDDEFEELLEKLRNGEKPGCEQDDSEEEESEDTPEE